jgi:hypothetical protein
MCWGRCVLTILPAGDVAYGDDVESCPGSFAAA